MDRDLDCEITTFRAHGVTLRHLSSGAERRRWPAAQFSRFFLFRRPQTARILVPLQSLKTVFIPMRESTEMDLLPPCSSGHGPPQSRARSAENGSSSDLLFLLRVLFKATDGKLVLVLPLLYLHLDTSVIPMPKDLDSILCDVSRHAELGRITGALAALRAISEMLEVQLISPAAYSDL